MKKTLMDLYGTWILFFHYLKWPVVIGLPILYMEMDYKRDMVMDILWVYCLYLVLESLYKRFVLKQKCDSDKCK